jgi:hypothetical protein
MPLGVYTVEELRDGDVAALHRYAVNLLAPGESRDRGAARSGRAADQWGANEHGLGPSATGARRSGAGWRWRR